MASAAILLIMVGCAVAQYLKGGLVKSFLTLIAALLASFVALWWYEQVSVIVVKQEIMVDFAQPACFGMLFLISFAILQTATMAISRQKIDFGNIPERIGRVVFGLLLGYVISGVLLIGVSMAPLPSEYPYQRFDGSKHDLQKASGALLNPDGFLGGFFGIISGGSVGGTQSFAVLHAGFIDELSLNRLPINQKVKVLADAGTVTMSPKSVWPAPDGLKDTEGKLVQSKAGCDLIVARVGFAGRALSGDMTTSQLRFQCRKKGEKPRLQGTAVSVYPIGYLQSANQVKTVGINERITFNAKNVQNGVLSMNFVCYVPKDYEPVVVGLKTNAIVEAPSMVAADQAPKESSPAPEKPNTPQDANAAK
jgi:Colicin V production protein